MVRTGLWAAPAADSGPVSLHFSSANVFLGGSREEHVVLKPAVSFIWIRSHTDKTVFIWARTPNQATLAFSRTAEYLCHHPPFSLSFWGHKIDTISEGFWTNRLLRPLDPTPKTPPSAPYSWWKGFAKWHFFCLSARSSKRETCWSFVVVLVSEISLVATSTSKPWPCSWKKSSWYYNHSVLSCPRDWAVKPLSRLSAGQSQWGVDGEERKQSGGGEGCLWVRMWQIRAVWSGQCREQSWGLGEALTLFLRSGRCSYNP